MALGQGTSGVKDAMIGFLNRGNVGGAQTGTSNTPMAPKMTGGIVIPASQLGPVAEGDVITLRVTSVDGENVSLEKVEEPTTPEAPTTPPIQ